MIVAGLILALTLTIILGVASSLNGVAWFGGGANEIQWASGVATFASCAAGIMLYLNRTCAASWRCLRFGEHPVKGTLRKVCDRHHTLEDHEVVHDRHSAAHKASGRLERGQSHGRTP